MWGVTICNRSWDHNTTSAFHFLSLSLPSFSYSPLFLCIITFFSTCAMEKSRHCVSGESSPSFEGKAGRTRSANLASVWGKGGSGVSSGDGAEGTRGRFWHGAASCGGGLERSCRIRRADPRGVYLVSGTRYYPFAFFFFRLFFFLLSRCRCRQWSRARVVWRKDAAGTKLVLRARTLSP